MGICVLYWFSFIISTDRATKDFEGRKKGVYNKSKLTEHGVNKTQPHIPICKTFSTSSFRVLQK